MTFKFWTIPFGAIILAGLLSACRNAPPDANLTGYIEGTHVYLNSPQAARIEAVSVSVGNEVQPGQTLVALETSPLDFQLSQLQARLVQKQALLADLQKGGREEDLAVWAKQIDAQKSMVEYAYKEKMRWEKTQSQDFSSRSQLDLAIQNYSVAQARLAQLEAQYVQAQLPAREGQIVAMEADIRQIQSSLDELSWQIHERTLRSAQAGVVEEVFYRSGEFVAQGVPILSLLLMGEQKVRFFVPQSERTRLQLGQTVQVKADGRALPESATLSHISPHAEYTPPVIYSQDVRSKLVFLVEARLAPESTLPIGQPVDVILP